MLIDDEEQVTEMHECARDPTPGVDGHLPPEAKMNETRKVPYLACQLSLFFYHRLVILMDARLGVDGIAGTHKNLY